LDDLLRIRNRRFERVSNQIKRPIFHITIWDAPHSVGRHDKDNGRLIKIYGRHNKSLSGQLIITVFFRWLSLSRMRFGHAIVSKGNNLLAVASLDRSLID
jgi:hypothetical protein